MDPSRRLTLFLLVVLGLAFVGFLVGTSPRDYDLPSPLTRWDEGRAAPGASTGARAGGDDAIDAADVVTACIDCHDDRASEASRGAHREHPVGVRLGRAAKLADLSAKGGRTGTDSDGGAIVICRSCHRPHQPEQEARLVDDVDSGELCLACHLDQAPGASQHPVTGAPSDGARAAIATLGGPAGELSCLSCHAVHEAASGTLLRTAKAGSQACRSCHAEQARALVGEGHGGEDCTDCHGVHARPAHALNAPRAPDPGDQACVDCHGVDGPDGSGAAAHPLWKALPAWMSGLERDSTLGCTDCHAPHGNAAATPGLLESVSTQRTCTRCHPAQSTVVGTDHDGEVQPVGGVETTCVTCHSAHGANAPPRAPGDVNPASGVCLSCHDGRTRATRVEAYSHPTGVLLTTSGLPARYDGKVPYFGPDGAPTKDRELGQIACQSCHDPHRWKHGVHAKPGAAEGTEQDSFLRDPAEVVAFCTVCHGADARPRFRFFHDQTYRAGDDDPSTAPPARPTPGGSP